MRTPLALCLALAFAVAPLALAHNPEGTPKSYCEPYNEWLVHDWNQDPPKVRLDLGGPSDASPPTAPLSHGGDPKYVWTYADGNVNDCDWDGVAFDYDGHHEFGIVGTALLSVHTGDGYSYGSLYCWHEEGHHAPFGPVSVTDVTFGAGVPFTVGADRVNIFWDDSCGDFQMDDSADCVGTCVVTFPPGTDGAYHVVVNGGSMGHVYTA